MPTGTKEWAPTSVNCCFGCSHGCRYCYARYNAVRRWKTIEAADWPKMEVNEDALTRTYSKFKGMVMFPTTHDITLDVLDPCMKVLAKLLEAGNKVLVVSKPHWVCIKSICETFVNFKGQILFRFTIGGDNYHLAYWEPGAPSFDERMLCLAMARRKGFETSVSMEPLLETDIDVVSELIDMFDPLVSETIWIGKMNHIDERVEILTDEDARKAQAIRDGQTDERVTQLYRRFKDNPKIQWKDSIREVIGNVDARV